MSKLETVVFQVTTRCPYNCPQCYMQRGDQDLDLEFAKEVIDSAHSEGAQAIQLTGGEPMLYPHLTELIRYAHKKGMYSFLASSGYGHCQSSYTDLRNSGLTILCISINDIDEKENALTRQSYTESLAAIQTARRTGLTCFANVVVTDRNIDRLELLGQYLGNRGVSAVCLLRPMPSADGKYIPTLSDSSVIRMDQIVSASPDFYHVENCFRQYWMYKNGYFRCTDAGNTTYFVNVDKTFSFCSKNQKNRYKSPKLLVKALEKWKEECYDK